MLGYSNRLFRRSQPPRPNQFTRQVAAGEATVNIRGYGEDWQAALRPSWLPQFANLVAADGYAWNIVDTYA